MNDRQRRNYERGQRVDSFMDANSQDFLSTSKGGTLAAHLKTELANVTTLDVTKVNNVSTRHQGTVGRGDVRKALREQIKALCETAELVTIDHSEVKGVFTRKLRDRSDRTLIAIARSYAAAAAEVQLSFVEYNMPADFVASMNANADSLEQFMSRQTEGTGARVNTNAAIEESLQRMSETIERLDVIVRNRYRDDPAKLAAWQSARHLERAPRSKTNGDGAQTTPTNNQTPATNGEAPATNV